MGKGSRGTTWIQARKSTRTNSSGKGTKLVIPGMGTFAHWARSSTLTFAESPPHTPGENIDP